MAQAPEVTRAKVRKRTVKVQAHERQVSAKAGAAKGVVASGQRWAGLAADINKKDYAAKPLAQRQASVAAARKAGPTQRTRAQRVILETHGERVSAAGQGRGALAKRWGEPGAAAAFGKSRPKPKVKAAAITPATIIQTKLATDADQAAKLRATLAHAHGPEFLNRASKSAVAFTMKQLIRPSAAIGSGLLSAIEDPKLPGQPGQKNSVVEGFKHPEEHGEDWNKVVEHAGIHNKYLKGAVALTASIVTDPTTYATLGFGTLAKEAGAQAARQALKNGADLDEALRLGRKAADATGPAGQRTGIKVGVRGIPVRAVTGKREVMTKPLGPATAQRVANARDRVAATAAAHGIRHVPVFAKPAGGRTAAVKEGLRPVMNPNVRPRGWEHYEWEIAKQAGNTGRAAERASQHRAAVAAHTYHQATKKWSEADHREVLDALERGDLSGLAPDKLKIATEMQRTFEKQRLAEPGRPDALGPDARVGFAARPTPPSFKHPVGGADIRASRATVRAAAQQLEEAEAAAQAAVAKAATSKSKKAQALPALAHTAVDQARASVERAARGHALLRDEARRQRAAVRAHEAATTAYEGAPQGYVARILKPGETLDTARPRPGGKGPNIGSSTSYQSRTAHKALADMSPEDVAKFETHIPKIMQARELEHGRILAAQEQHKWLSGLADPLQLSAKDATALDGSKRALFARDEMGVHSLFDPETGAVRADRLREHIAKGSEISEVNPDKLAVVNRLTRGGKPHEINVADLLRPAPNETREHLLKRIQRTWKWWATAPNPSYHARNLIGDTFNAMTAGTTTGDFRRAFQLNRANSAMRHVERRLGTPEGRRSLEVLRKAAGRTHHYPAVGELSDLEVMALANKYGAINTGLVSGELRDLQLSAEGAVAKHVAPARDAIQAAGDWRENAVRFATFHNGLKQGMTPSEAAAFSLRHHIDYSNLSDVERSTLRYIFPFWTWWSRNVPLQLTKVATRPGLYGNVEKARRQSLVAQGVDPNIAESMPDYDQENLPWGTPWHQDAGGKHVPVLAGPGLPYMDIGSVPLPHGDTGETLKGVARDVVQRLNPFVKLGIEEATGLNTFTLKPHEEFGEGRYVPAPPFLPDGFPGVATKYNKKTGKMEKMVNWRVLSAINTAPIASRLGKVSTTRTDPGKPTAGMAAWSWALGPRFAPADPRQLKINQLYDARNKVDAWITEHKGDYKHTTGEPWTGPVGKQYKARTKIDDQINELKRQMGFKNVRKRGRPRGSGSSGGTFGAGGGSGGMFGTGG